VLVIGIDPSAKKIAMVARDSTLNVSDVAVMDLYVKGAKKQTPESIHAAMSQMVANLARIEHMMTTERYAYVEQPLVGRGGINTTMKQAYVGGVIQACLVEAGFTVVVVHPSTWRSGLGVKGKGTVAVKADTRRYVMVTDPKLFAKVKDDSDLTDAGAICLYGTDQAESARRTAAAKSPGRRVQRRGRRSVVRPAHLRT
jgi:hypothetical protein